MGAIRKKNLTLLALALAEGKPLSPVQLQKAVFLLQAKLPANVLPKSKIDRYEFVAHNYGPFSSEVYKDAQMLAEQGLVTVDQSSTQKYAEYAANEHGLKLGVEIAEQLPPEAVTFAKELVDWVHAQTFRSLVSAIYKEYPKYKARSIFND